MKVELHEEEFLDFSITSGPQADKYFYGRRDEIELLHECFENGTHIALRADRQHGKTALADKAIERLNKDSFTCIDLNLHRSTDITRLKSSLLKKYIEANTGKGKLFVQPITFSLNALKNIFSDVKIKIPGLDISLGKIEESLEEGQKLEAFVNILELINTLSKAQSKKTVIFLDEIQHLIEIAGDNYDNFARALRAAIQHLTHVTILIAGSEPSIVRKMTTPGSTKFLTDFEDIPVQGIKYEAFEQHLLVACEQRSIEIESSVPVFCHKLTHGIASNLSYFGNKILEKGIASKKVTWQDVISISFDCINRLEAEFKEKKETLDALDEEAYYLFSSLADESYYHWEEPEVIKYDPIIVKLMNSMYIEEDESKKYIISDPLFLLYLQNPTYPERKRLSDKLLTENPEKLLASQYLLT